MTDQNKLVVAAMIGACVGVAAIIFIARRRIKKLPLWRRVLLAFASKK